MKEFEGGTRVGLSVTIIFDDEEKKLLIKPINAPHLPSMYTYTTDDIMCFKELGAIGVRIILSNSSRIELYFPDLYYRNEISRRIQNLIDVSVNK